ncbi:hypothetical protein [Sporisorium scitamineum]|uniref:Uncharacterized protein n=1 Tax=Sporisorium scitamineum TaxID=49012 RepID=A0A0F7S6G4_9BASI|nr:hypothetical protein [Sporisorium scitamineum]
MAWLLRQFETYPPYGRTSTNDHVRIELFLQCLPVNARSWCQAQLHQAKAIEIAAIVASDTGLAGDLVPARQVPQPMASNPTQNQSASPAERPTVPGQADTA